MTLGQVSEIVVPLSSPCFFPQAWSEEDASNWYAFLGSQVCALCQRFR